MNQKSRPENVRFTELPLRNLRRLSDNLFSCFLLSAVATVRTAC